MTPASPAPTMKVACPECRAVHTVVFDSDAPTMKVACGCGKRLRVQRTGMPPPPSTSVPTEVSAAEEEGSEEAGLAAVRRAWADAVGSVTDEGMSLKSMESDGLGASAALAIAVSMRVARGSSACGRATAAPTPPTRVLAMADAPEKTGDFVVGKLIGRGGMGRVYRAEQSVLGRTVALKTLRAKRMGDASSRLKFLYEARVTGQLDHPNIVPVYDLGSARDGTLFYTMKEVKGHAWSQTVHELRESENIDILLKVADAVAYAHGKGVVHRDIKPGNVMLGEYGEVLLLDWGLAARFTKAGLAERLTSKNARSGTPAYMAPEMAAGNAAAVGAASDVYLLGAVLHEILTGKRPHHGEDVFECINAALMNQWVETERRDEWMETARKAMATRPEDRYKTVKAFQQALRDCRDHAASRLVATEAQQAFTRAEREQFGRYGDYARAVFGFEEALRLWPGNAMASKGLTKARRAYGEAALDRGDYALAVAQSAALTAGEAGDLPERAARAQRAYVRHRRRTTVLGGVAMALIAAMAVYGVYAMGQEDRANRRAKEAEAKIREAEAKIREVDRRIQGQKDETARNHTAYFQTLMVEWKTKNEALAAQLQSARTAEREWKAKHDALAARHNPSPVESVPD